MPLLTDILDWSTNLPNWQRDALRRVFLKGDLDSADLVEVVQLVKAEHGIGQSTIPPDPLSTEHLPVSPAPNTSVALVHLEELRDVNLFPAGRSMEFAFDRLNVIFGENGAGKSGYARVLKNACRARHRQPVLPNAFNEAQPRPIPSAGITFLEDGNPRRITWLQGGPSEPALGSISVYDSLCGADYLAREGASDFQPYGLPQLNRLAAAQKIMAATLEQERMKIPFDINAFRELNGDHEVGRLIAGLNPNSNIDDYRTLAGLTPEENQRLDELAQILSNMNPEPEARKAEMLSARLDIAANSAQLAQRFVSDQALDEVKQRKEAELAAQTAWTIAQERLHSSEDGSNANLLPGTGNDVWKTLFVAAERFSRDHAYPHHDHPNVEDGARCVLCQSTMNEEARARMGRFAEFVANEASQLAQATSERMVTTMRQIATANLSPLDAPTAEELADVDADLRTFSAHAEQTFAARRHWVQSAVQENEWLNPRPELPEGTPLDARLRAKAESLRARARELRNTLDPEAKARLEKERVALGMRRRLGEHLPAIEKRITDTRAMRDLADCGSALNPRKVSLKMTELAGKYVTQALAETMNQELRALGYRRKVEPHITGRTDVGQTMVSLKLKDTPEGAHLILSEGEQRAMGLAMFLAEARLQDHRSTVVFDDPSTSLDHHHRRSMAHRLADLALERPVIVLTHDAVFLAEINHAVRRSQQPVAYQTVSWDSRPGLVKPGLTWETMDCDSRVEDLERTAKPLRDVAADYMDDATKESIKTGYTKLRGTVERAIREIFLNNAVLPFSDEVSVDSVGVIVDFSQDDWNVLSQIYARCCEVTDAHDTNAAHQLPIPNPDEFLGDLEEFKKLLSSAKKRRSAYQKERGERGKARKKPFEEV